MKKKKRKPRPGTHQTRFVYELHPSRPLANSVAPQYPSGTNWTPLEASDKVHRSSTENFRSPTLQVAVYSTRLRHWNLPAAYPEGTQQRFLLQPRAHAHDDVDVAVHSRVVPTRAPAPDRVHAHVAQHLAFHCVPVRRSPLPEGQRASSGEGETMPVEARQAFASPKAVFENKRNWSKLVSFFFFACTAASSYLLGCLATITRIFLTISPSSI